MYMYGVHLAFVRFARRIAAGSNRRVCARRALLRSHLCIAASRPMTRICTHMSNTGDRGGPVNRFYEGAHPVPLPPPLLLLRCHLPQI